MWVFLGVIALNSYFSFKAGESSGKWVAVLGTIRFLSKSNALKSSSNIDDFNEWPQELREAYNNKEVLK